MLFAYDILSKHTVWHGTRVSSSIKTTDGETLAKKFANLTQKDIEIAYVYEKGVLDALKKGDDIPEKPQGLSENASHFLKNVKKVSSFVPHTMEHSKWNRAKIFSYNLKYGKASFWFTFNPTTQNHKVMVFFATGEKCEVPPSAFTRFQQLANFPRAQALFFQEFCKVS